MAATLAALKRALTGGRRDRGEPPPRETKRAGKKRERGARKLARATRSRFLADARDLTPYVAAPVGDEVIFVSTRDAGIGREVFETGWRKDLTVLSRALEWLAEEGFSLPEQPVFVDVGANVGTTTVMALRRHGFASAVAIEPSPENSRLLRVNVAANDLDDRVQAFAVAASDREGDLWLDVTRTNSGGHEISAADANGSVGGTVRVPAVTLDALVARGVVEPERVGLLWIDAQGHDGQVLAGASSFVRAAVPTVVAIRPEKGDPAAARPWRLPPAIRATLVPRLVEAYTHAVELRKHSKQGRKVHPIAELDRLVDSFTHCQDLLLVRR